MGSEAVSSRDRRVRDLVHSVVEDLAPDELPLVEGLFRFNDAKVVLRLSGRSRVREPLGFGMGEIAVLVTPVVWLALNQAAQRIADKAMDGATSRTTPVLRRIFRRRAAPVTIPPLTREQLGDVRRLVLAAAKQQGVSDKRADQIADAVVARLVLAEPGTPVVDGTRDQG